MNETIHAPDFPYDFQWINTSHPLSLYDDLSGYVLLVWFWTSSNVNCHHVVPTLHYLEQRFADRSFRVIGVHTGKFTAERDHDHVVAAVRRLGIRHPVVVDEGGEMWKAYEARAWPYLCLVDATGHFRFHGAGEPDRERMAAAIEGLLDEAAAEGQEPWGEVHGDEHDAPETRAGLRFPTGLCFDESRKWLWIADAGRHRVVAVDPSSGKVEQVVGTGDPGAADGPFEQAAFYQPQSLLVCDRSVFVADAGNHLLRRIDLDEGRVDTVLGTGRPVVDFEGGGSGPAQPLNSPWGLQRRGDELFVSMAGQHQIWRVELDTMTASPLAGSHSKGVHDGPVYDASFAQPAGLARIADRLYVLDSDTSALRWIDLSLGEVMSDVRGHLYKWGSDDGHEPKMQYPRGLAAHGTDLYIADTGNDRVRRFRSGEMTTLDLTLLRPEGVAVHGDTLFVADTGNHRIVKVDLAAAADAEAAESPAIEVLPVGELPLAPTAFATDYDTADPIALPPLGQATLRFPLGLPPGTQLEVETRATLTAENLEGHPLMVDVDVAPDLDGEELVARGLDTGDEGEGVIRLRLVFLTAKGRGQVCHVHERRFDVPVRLAPGVEAVATVRRRLPS